MEFSTQWKNIFHSVENSDFWLFSVVFGLFAGGWGAKRAAPHVSRTARPTEGTGKTVPDEGGQHTQAQPPRVRRSGRPFFRSRGRGFLARSGETGAVRVKRS
jgi:hypothetical protein